MRSQHKKFLIILLASFWLCFSPALIDFMALPASAYIHQQTIVRENGSLTSNLKREYTSDRHYTPRKTSFLLAQNIST